LVVLSIFIQNCAGYKGAGFNKNLSKTNDSVSENDDLTGLIEQEYSIEETEYLEMINDLEDPEQSLLEETTGITETNLSKIASKIKCTLYFKGEKGAERLSERYVAANENCSKELATVRSNNPKAHILRIVENFVFDALETVDKTKCTYFSIGPKGAKWF